MHHTKTLPFGIDFTLAFQPIIDTQAGGAVFAYEALVRGPGGEGAKQVFGQVPAESAVAFDAACRSRAVSIAAGLNIPCNISLNISATAICDGRYGIPATMRSARQTGFPLRNLIFEMTEHDPVSDMSKLGRWIAAARKRDIKVAIDDFGAGYAGLSNLLELRPQIVKLDVALVRGIDTDQSRQALVKGIIDACQSFGCDVIAEGVETNAEFSMLSVVGITLMQGYLFAKPSVATLPSVKWPLVFANGSISMSPSREIVAAESINE